jgi:hypothetical protein
MESYYVYWNETGEQVASYRADTASEALALAMADYDINDYHMSQCDQAVSNA